MKPQFCIIGTGYIFLKHLEAIREIGGEITEATNENACLNWKQVISKTKAKYVVILTPNYLHAEMANYATSKGKIVLCEKPLIIKEEKLHKNIYPVLQLRHHPLVSEMRKAVKKDNKVELEIAVKRDKEYFKGWKGDESKSGGMLFNLGVHYFDLAFYLTKGKKVEIINKITATETEKNPRRIIRINGKEFNLSSKDNLSEENLHKYIYRDLIKGKKVASLKEIQWITKWILKQKS